MHNPKTAEHKAMVKNVSHQGSKKFTNDAISNVHVYVTILLIWNTSVIIPEIIRPNMLAIPTTETNKAACEVGRFLDTPRSGI